MGTASIRTPAAVVVSPFARVIVMSPPVAGMRSAGRCWPLAASSEAPPSATATWETKPGRISPEL